MVVCSRWPVLRLLRVSEGIDRVPGAVPHLLRCDLKKRSLIKDEEARGRQGRVSSGRDGRSSMYALYRTILHHRCYLPYLFVPLLQCSPPAPHTRRAGPSSVSGRRRRRRRRAAHHKGSSPAFPFSSATGERMTPVGFSTIALARFCGVSARQGCCPVRYTVQYQLTSGLEAHPPLPVHRDALNCSDGLSWAESSQLQLQQSQPASRPGLLHGWKRSQSKAGGQPRRIACLGPCDRHGRTRGPNCLRAGQGSRAHAHIFI